MLRGLPWALAVARRRLDADRLEVFTALGHGRSYGRRSSILGRALPGIVDCALWRDLERRPRTPTWALVTDIGNDVAYGFAPDLIAGWIATCVERLQQHGAQIALTALPLARLERLQPWQIELTRNLLFPSSTVAPAEIQQRVRELDQRLHDLAAHHGLPILEPLRTWYGVDPIHVRRRARHTAWEQMLATWGEGENARPAVPGFLDALRLRFLVPEERWLFGFVQRRKQPAGQLQSCPVWLY